MPDARRPGRGVGRVSGRRAATARDVNPLVSTVEIPSAGHGVHYEQPEAFIAAVQDFLSPV